MRAATRVAVRAAFLAPYTRFWLYGDVIFSVLRTKEGGDRDGNHTKRWSVQIFIDEHDGTTRAEVRLEPPIRRTSSVSEPPDSTRTISTCRRSETSSPPPGALSELAHRLLEATVEDIEGITPSTGPPGQVRSLEPSPRRGGQWRRSIGLPRNANTSPGDRPCEDPSRTFVMVSSVCACDLRLLVRISVVSRHQPGRRVQCQAPQGAEVR